MIVAYGLLKPERLGRVSDPDGLLIHAAYPTGKATLCGRPTTGGDRRRLTLTCPICAATAKVWDRIDKGGG